jgi:hypothetical protein
MKEFKKPDLKAPRFRPEVYNVLNKEFFEKFKEKNPKYKNLDNAMLKKIIKTFNQLVYHTVVETRDGVQLPESIGWLFIGTCEQSKKDNIDFAKSHKYGVKVTNKNWESDGKLAKIFFSNYAPKHKMKNREYWSFNACRDFKRLVAKTYPENWQMYVVADPKTKLEHAYSRLMYKHALEKQTAKALETYNEFEL